MTGDYKELREALEANDGGFLFSIHCNVETIRNLLAELDALRKDAERWSVVLACVRQGQFGEWVIHEDDPHNDDVTKAMFTAAIDAATKANARGCGGPA